MTENPYGAPNSNISNAARNPAQNPRPISVWIFLLLVMFFVSALVSGLFKLGSAAPSGGITEQTAKLLLIAFFAIYIVFACVLVWLGIAAFKAKRWARWGGSVFLLICMFIALTTPNNRQYTDAAEAAGAHIGRLILFPLLFVLWIYFYGFSKKAKEYFLRPR